MSNPDILDLDEQKRIKQIHEDTLKYLQVFAVIFSFVLFVEIHLLKLSYEIVFGYNYKIRPTLPDFVVVIFMGCLPLFLMTTASMLSYGKLWFPLILVKTSSKTIIKLILISLILFMVWLLYFFIDTLLLFIVWGEQGVYVLENISKV